MSVPQIARLVKTTLTTSDTNIYQVPTGYTASITQIMLCNTHSAAVTIDVAITGSSATSSATTDRIFSSLSLSANESMMVMTNVPIFAGEKVWADASIGGHVNIVISGVLTAD